ncbi:hypothetical protein ENBRE01_0106 [Enteropsectra breve]|nr:hypothetical protein ENBRE01_0106 [Enteropsectra breve]
MHLFIWILGALGAAASKRYRLEAIKECTGGVKSYTMYERYYEEVYKLFPPPHYDPLSSSWTKNIFMYLDGDKLVAHCEVVVLSGVEGFGRFRNGKQANLEYAPVSRSVPRLTADYRKETKYISFYTIMVPEEYRGQGQSQMLMLGAIKDLKESMSLADDTVLTLHLSYKTDHMFVAAKNYYNLGFRKGIFVKRGPYEYLNKIEVVVDNARDLYDVCGDLEEINPDGPFFMLYCRLRDLKYQKAAPSDWAAKGKLLMEKLKSIDDANKENEDSEE